MLDSTDLDTLTRDSLAALDPPEAPSAPDGAGPMLRAADRAAEKALSDDSEEFLARHRQRGGE